MCSSALSCLGSSRRIRGASPILFRDHAYRYYKVKTVIYLYRFLCALIMTYFQHVAQAAQVHDVAWCVGELTKTTFFFAFNIYSLRRNFLL
jgi:hypothetical protein